MFCTTLSSDSIPTITGKVVNVLYYFEF